MYFIYDNYHIELLSDYKVYQEYKPEINKANYSFKELQKINPDVIGWINIENTTIDYPITKGINNREYLDKTPLGEHLASGSLFLDCENASDLSDYNSIIYGHHMANGSMFGNLDKFSNASYFNKHRWVRIFTYNTYIDYEIIAYLENVDSYDDVLYNPFKIGENNAKYSEYIYELSKNSRRCLVDVNDRFLLLSTCSNAKTNGRNILVCVTNKRDRHSVPILNRRNIIVPIWLYILDGIFLIVLIVLVLIIKRKRRN